MPHVPIMLCVLKTCFNQSMKALSDLVTTIPKGIPYYVFYIFILHAIISFIYLSYYYITN